MIYLRRTTWPAVYVLYVITVALLSMYDYNRYIHAEIKTTMIVVHNIYSNNIISIASMINNMIINTSIRCLPVYAGYNFGRFNYVDRCATCV